MAPDDADETLPPEGPPSDTERMVRQVFEAFDAHVQPPPALEARLMAACDRPRTIIPEAFAAEELDDAG